MKRTPLGPADARRHRQPAHGLVDGHPHAVGRRADLRARLRHRRHRRRGAQPDRQRLAQSRPGLHHRQLHGRGVRRRRQSLGHAGRRLVARHRSTSSSSPMPARCSARSWCSSSSSCSSRSARAACSRSRAGRWKHDHRPLLRRRRRPPHRSSTIALLVAVAIIVPVLNLALPAGQRAARAVLHGGADRQVSLLRAAGARRSTWSGAIAASSRSATAPSSRSAAMRWACT